MPPPVIDVAIEIRKLRLILLALLMTHITRAELDAAITKAIEIDALDLP